MILISKSIFFLQPNLSSLTQSNAANSAGSSDESDDDESPAKKVNRKSKGSKDAGIYVAPKLSAVHYGDDDTKAERNRKQFERARKRALK